MRACRVPDKSGPCAHLVASAAGSGLELIHHALEEHHRDQAVVVVLRHHPAGPRHLRSDKGGRSPFWRRLRCLREIGHPPGAGHPSGICWGHHFGGGLGG